MNNRVNYGLVGFLVLLGFMLMFAFGYWLLRPASSEETTNYLIYFNESVLGLNQDAPVKYRGINVGKVTRIRINPNNSEQVEIKATILKSTPIKKSTVAKLTAQGVTGLSYINLSLGNKDDAPLVAQKGEKYPVIQTSPSFFENFEKSFGTVSTQLSRTLRQTQQLLNQENQEQVAQLLKNSAYMFEKIDKLLDETTIKHIQNSAKNLDNITQKTNILLPHVDTFIDKSSEFEGNISTSFHSIMNSYLNIKGSMTGINQSIAKGASNVKEVTSDVIPVLNETLMQMHEVLINVEKNLDKYSRSPSDIFFKKEELKKAPGEK